MKTYQVEVTANARAAIREQAHYIAVERQAPVNAQRWLRSVWTAVDSLETFPHRGSLAEEDCDVEYEARQILVSGGVLIYTVSQTEDVVWVLAYRGDGELPKSNQLPPNQAGLQD